MDGKPYYLYVLQAWKYKQSTQDKTEVRVNDKCKVKSVTDHESFYEVRVIHKGEELVTFGQYIPGLDIDKVPESLIF